VKFIAGLILGLIIIPAIVYFYFSTGMAPVATAAQAMPFEKMLARKALHARIEKEAPKSVPISADETNFAAGAQIYTQQCAVCHGLPDQEETAISKGMFPRPPQLFRGHGVTDDPPEETYWKVAGGLRMTGMPAFKNSLSDTQMWQVSLLLANADKISPSVKSALAQPAAANQAPAKSAPTR
jgi:thiosulfate dehydrogenase